MKKFYSSLARLLLLMVVSLCFFMVIITLKVLNFPELDILYYAMAIISGIELVLTVFFFRNKEYSEYIKSWTDEHLNFMEGKVRLPNGIFSTTMLLIPNAILVSSVGLIKNHLTMPGGDMVIMLGILTLGVILSIPCLMLWYVLRNKD